MKNTNNSKYWKECREIGSLPSFQWDIPFCQMSGALSKPEPLSVKFPA